MTAFAKTNTKRFSDSTSADRWVAQARAWSKENPACQVVDVIRDELDGWTRVTMVTEYVIYGPHCDHTRCPLTGCDQVDHLPRSCSRPETCPHCGPWAWCPNGHHRVLAVDCPSCHTA